MKLRRFVSPAVGVGLIMAIATTGLGSRSVAAPPRTRATEANITRITTSVLENSQFAHRPFDSALARVFLHRYVDALDGTRSLLLQADVDEFAARYGPTLAQTTSETGDTAAANAIFGRYLDRLEQRASYVGDILRKSKFDFTGHDAYSFDREHQRRPRDLTEAQAAWRQQLRAEYLQEKLNDEHPEPIASTLTRRYTQRLRNMKALGPDEVLEIYLDALAHVYDPHSDYLGHEQMESLSIAMHLSLVGIGATLETVDGYCKIRDLVPGGPAARSGLLKPGDRIVAVAQAGKELTDVVNMPLSRTVELIRGPKGTTVTLKVVPVGAPDGSLPKMASIVRDEVKLADQQAKARVVDLPSGKGTTLRLGVINLPSFYADIGTHDAAGHRSATADVERLLGKLKAEHVQGVVLDLRRNGGGSLEEAISLTGLFIRKGPVVQTRDQAGDIEVGMDPDPAVVYDGPLVLLTSRFSASASEILAGALQDYGRALVVGDSSTFGKGTVQNILPLARVMDQVGLAHSYDPGALKVTTSKFYRPSGASTQLRGVASDIVLPSTSDIVDVGESKLKDPLPWDVIPSTSYDHLNRVRSYVFRLREESTRRVAENRDFGFLAGDIARLKRSLETKAISLNEAERRQEQARDKARHDDRERADQALRATRPNTYEITLENASSPGLPPPVVFASDAGKASPAVGTSTADDVDELTSGQSAADDIILDETLGILADYVKLLAGVTPQGDRVSYVTDEIGGARS